MKKANIKKITVSAAMIALCMLLPFLTGHIADLGNALLPMHLPVLIAAYTVGAPCAALVGLVSPVLRSLIFSAPTLFPRAVAMSVELAFLGFFAGFLFRIIKLPRIASIYVSQISAMLISRAAWGVVQAALLGFGENGFTLAYFISEAFVLSLPGIVLQLVLVPLLISALYAAKLLPIEK